MQKNLYAIIAGSIGLAVILIQVAIGVVVFYTFPDWQTRGQFGDVFGVANALFSGLAFVGVIYAILLQREELSLQRRELELTRQELTRAASAQEQSEIALRAQAIAAERSAKLAAINYLLEHYRVELNGMKGVAYGGEDPRRPRMKELQEKEQILLSHLDALFVEINRND